VGLTKFLKIFLTFFTFSTVVKLVILTCPSIEHFEYWVGFLAGIASTLINLLLWED
jgi:hypothetical protein